MLSIYVLVKASKRKVLWAKIHNFFTITQVCVTQRCVNYRRLITKYISNNFRKIEVVFFCFGRAPNPKSYYPKMTKKPKKNVVIKKSRTFASENEYYLVARPTFYGN